ncbi:hypothetical protein PV328_005781 [Microctonus aethiopoides]|uniref:Maturase n=1 Tax=Microctonus aethiopoides TaxID=144406 RepID=A0AA39KSV3_9HYME|nr:hypothetical protein PV328_005781 [Microctonus aethiopoides]
MGFLASAMHLLLQYNLLLRISGDNYSETIEEIQNCFNYYIIDAVTLRTCQLIQLRCFRTHESSSIFPHIISIDWLEKWGIRQLKLELEAEWIGRSCNLVPGMSSLMNKF